MANITNGIADASRQNRKGGRPPVRVSGPRVRELRGAGMSWRSISRTLGIGTATAMRLYHAVSRAEEASQNSEVVQAGTMPSVVILTRRIAPLPKGADPNDKRTWPVNGRSPGPCPDCGSKAWRLRADGALDCSVCRPLN
jgi:hypothetical protein